MAGVTECSRGHLITRDDPYCTECTIEDWFEEEKAKNPSLGDVETYKAGWFAHRVFKRAKAEMERKRKIENSWSFRLLAFFKNLFAR